MKKKFPAHLRVLKKIQIFDKKKAKKKNEITRELSLCVIKKFRDKKTGKDKIKKDYISLTMF